MLNNEDVEFIKANREQITQKRNQPLTLLGERGTGGFDPLTGEEIVEQVEIPSEGVFKSQTGTEDLQYVNGVKVQGGDAIVSFDIDVDLNGIDRIGKADGEEWGLVAKDKVGLAEPNRYECIARKVT